VPPERDFLVRLSRMDILHDVCLGRPTGNEENIKVKVVAPVLEQLGYDRIREFDYERHVPKGRPDIVLLVEDKPRLIVEAKGLDKDLEEYKDQGLGYANDLGIPWTILTNGVQWDLYKTWIDGVPQSENEPILTIFSRDLRSRFAELEGLVSRSNISALEQTSASHVQRLARKAKVSDLARIIQGLRVLLFVQLRKQFDARYGTDAGFTGKVDDWVREQGIDKGYDWYEVFEDDKKFRAYVLTTMRGNGLPGTPGDFSKVYRKPGRDETTGQINSVLRGEGVPIDWPDKLCFEGAYSLINRLLFLRICEDSGLIPREVTPDLIEKIRRAKDNSELTTRLEGIFASMRSSYPGVYKLPLLDHLHLSDLAWDTRAVADLCEETLKYNFSELGDVLGDLYQKHLSHNARRLIGQFYTHEEKVDFMLEAVDPWLHDGVKVLDPACGSGSFLIGAYKRIQPQLLKAGYSTASAHRHLLEDVLYGVDVDTFAAQLTAINLLIRNMAEPVGSLRIYVGNSLTGENTLSRFGLEVPGKSKDSDPRGQSADGTVSSILQKGAYDVVLANPPFFRVGLTDGIYGPSLRSGEYAAVRPSGSEMNIATMFLKRAVDLLNDHVQRPSGKGGICALVLPKSFTYVDEYQLAREYLLSRCEIAKIVDLGRGWNDVGLEHIIIVFERKPGTDGKRSIAQEIAPQAITVVHDVASFRRGLFESHTVDSALISRDSRKRLFLYLDESSRPIYDKINRAGTPLRESGMDVWEGIRDNHKVAEFQVRQNARSVPLLRGSSIRRWFAEPAGFVDATDPRIPKGIREKCACDEKIVIKRVISSKVRVEAWIDRSRSITHSSTTAVTLPKGIDPRYVTGVFNSRLMNLYVRDWIYNRTELTMNFREEYLGEIPIPDKPDPSVREHICQSVDDLCFTSGPLAKSPPNRDEIISASAGLKGKLDAEVYRLYSLTPAEIATVEKLMPYSD
jgi:type I restriction-modification system DNA methylase subunit